MANRIAVLLALLALLAATALVIHDSFYAAIGVRPEDVGASDVDIVLRGIVLLGLPVAAAALAATGILVGVAWLTSRRAESGAASTRKVIPVVLTVLAAAAAAATVTAILVPGFRSFATGSFVRVAGALIIVLALATALALVIGSAGAVGTSSIVVGWLGLTVMTVAAVPTLLLARTAGSELAADAKEGKILLGGALDPLQVRAEKACILPAKRVDTALPARTYVLLGESTGGVVVYDAAIRRVFRVPAERVGVLGVADDVCRVPGAPVPVERGTPAEDAGLARLFRPVLRFDSREPWRPLNVERFLAESFPEPSPRHAICPPKGACSAVTSSADLSAARQRLDLRGSRSDGGDHRAPAGPDCAPSPSLLDCEGDASAIYFNVTRQDRRVYVDYWWFLRYNHFPFPIGRPGPCGGRPTPRSQHEGDWEGVTVVTKFNNPRELDYVVFSAHGHSVRYRRLKPALEDGRPVVFVACGSHAAYPVPCSGPRGCRQTSTCRPNPCTTVTSQLAEAPSDGARRWHRNADEACFERARTPCLLAFPSAPAPDGRGFVPSGWTVWPGRWGVRGGPRSPGRQGRFERPWDLFVSNRSVFDRRQPGAAPAAG